MTLPGGSSSGPLIEVDDLTIAFRQDGAWTTVVDGVSFHVGVGETLGVAGESGSGKSVTALALLGLVRELGGRVTGSIRFDGRELIALGGKEWDALRGQELSMIFQQPTRSLNPAFRVGSQIAETARWHLGLGRRAAWARAVEMLDLVGIPDAARRATHYPHQFSGGQAQRIMIALALVCDPRLLVADEPTTALDVTVQAHILDLLEDLQRRTGVSIILISHDLGVIGTMAHRVAVMYAGQIVEELDAAHLTDARHPYSRALIASMPSTAAGKRRLVAMPGTLPSFRDLPEGCRFHPRCAHAEQGTCTQDPIQLLAANGRDGLVRCVRSDVLFPSGDAS